jgi:hypothetical protein
VTGEVRKKAAFWLALVFVLGAATGGVFGFNLAHRSYASTKPAVLNDAERRAKKVDEMTREIGLDAEQAKKEDAIITEAQAEMRAIREKNESEIDAVRMKAREATRVFLTPEQKAKFEEYAKRMDEEHKKQREAQGH